MILYSAQHRETTTVLTITYSMCPHAQDKTQTYETEGHVFVRTLEENEANNLIVCWCWADAALFYQHDAIPCVLYRQYCDGAIDRVFFSFFSSQNFDDTHKLRVKLCTAVRGSAG